MTMKTKPKNNQKKKKMKICKECPKAEWPKDNCSSAVGLGMLSMINHNKGCEEWEKCQNASLPTPPAKDLRKIYYVNDLWELIEKPKPHRLGVEISEKFDDCWYALHHFEYCPKEGAEPTLENCPLVSGNNPCNIAKVKVCSCKVPNMKMKCRQTTLTNLGGIN